MRPEPIADESLMRLVVAGDRGAMEALVRRFAGPLSAFVRKLTGDAHRGEELVQDAFFMLWQKRDRYAWPRPFKPWLYTIALNRCRAWLRDGPPPAASLDGSGAEPVTAGASPAESAITGEAAGIVAVAIDRLPATQRAVVLLRVWEELSYADIADALGCTEGTARSHMHHALAALRKQLEHYVR
jgi:RNA polymerase sigma-70 factor (ECF subfamily)